jgi:hypothetical protein
MTGQGTELVGTWKSDPTDSAGTGAYGEATLKFGADGTLLYIVHESDRDQIMRLTYRAEPGFIVTDQPSEPRSERTEYHIGEDGILVLAFGGRKSRYLKVK